MEISKVCTKLGLRFGRYKNDAKAVMVKEGVITPTDEQLKEALDHVEEEHYAIVSLYKSDKHRYGILIKDMEKDILQKKDPFSSLTCAVYWQGGKNKFNSKYNQFSEVNDGIAFATMTSDATKKGKGKNKKVTCYRCKRWQLFEQVH